MSIPDPLTFLAIIWVRYFIRTPLQRRIIKINKHLLEIINVPESEDLSYIIKDEISEFEKLNVEFRDPTMKALLIEINRRIYNSFKCISIQDKL